jgi:opacity protein-like surface antigen
MKKMILSSLAALLVAGAANAAQQYGSVKGIFDIPSAKESNSGGSADIDLKTTFGGSLAYGFKFGDFRTELEGKYIFKASAKEAGDSKYGISNYGFMLNGYYDVKTGTKFVPYATLGLGWNQSSFKSWIWNVYTGYRDVDLSADSIAYQIGLGVAYNIDDNLSVELGYRYAGTLWGELNGYPASFPVSNSELLTSASEITLGARYAF